MPREYYVGYRGKDGGEIELGYRSFRVFTSHREIPEQEKVWAFKYFKEDFVLQHNQIAKYQYWAAWNTVSDYLADPFNPLDSRDGLGLVPVFDIRPAGDDPYTDPR